MTLNRWYLVFPVLGICLTALTGCTTTRPMVNTWQNPSFSPSRTNSIALKINANAHPYEVETGHLLAAELSSEGFVQAPEEQADYLLSFVVSGNEEEHVLAENQSAQQPALPTSQSAEGPGTHYVYAGVQKSYLVRVQDIRLFLYSNPGTNPAGLQLVWQGTITIGKDNSVKGELALLRTLLHYYGGVQNGTVALVK